MRMGFAVIAASVNAWAMEKCSYIQCLCHLESPAGILRNHIVGFHWMLVSLAGEHIGLNWIGVWVCWSCGSAAMLLSQYSLIWQINKQQTVLNAHCTCVPTAFKLPHQSSFRSQRWCSPIAHSDEKGMFVFVGLPEKKKTFLIYASWLVRQLGARTMKDHIFWISKWNFGHVLRLRLHSVYAYRNCAFHGSQSTTENEQSLAMQLKYFSLPKIRRRGTKIFLITARIYR